MTTTSQRAARAAAASRHVKALGYTTSSPSTRFNAEGVFITSAGLGGSAEAAVHVDIEPASRARRIAAEIARDVEAAGKYAVHHGDDPTTFYLTRTEGRD